ncbi:MAG TPA: LysM peptidoglycan-binding domain-containing protein [Spirillospora sp.]|nr:LysM peptidoglycan-binding domain-containing protein [Spirillospora sp.]
MCRFAQLLFVLTLLFMGLAVTGAFAQSNTYVVQPGDTLDGIARRFNLDTECLVQGNNILNPNSIRVGQTLNVSSCSPQAVPTSVASTYTIQRGDKLYEIAQRLGVEWGCLARVNALTNPSLIRPGTVLQVDPCIVQDGGAAPLPVRQNYVVQRGDRFVDIAHTFGLDVDCLARVNRIATPDFLIVGETLVLDFARCTAANG